MKIRNPVTKAMAIPRPTFKPFGKLASPHVAGNASGVMAEAEVEVGVGVEAGGEALPVTVEDRDTDVSAEFWAMESTADVENEYVVENAGLWAIEPVTDAAGKSVIVSIELSVIEPITDIEADGMAVSTELGAVVPIVETEQVGLVVVMLGNVVVASERIRVIDVAATSVVLYDTVYLMGGVANAGEDADMFSGGS